MKNDHANVLQTSTRVGRESVKAGTGRGQEQDVMSQNHISAICYTSPYGKLELQNLSEKTLKLANMGAYMHL